MHPRTIVRRTWKTLTALLGVFAVVVAFLGWRTADPRPADGWERLADLPAPRGEVASAVLGDALYVMGGISGLGRTVDRVDVFREGEWTDGPALPEPRHHAAAAVLDGVVYVTGGSTRATDWTPLASGWSLADGRWTPLPAMPEGRMGHQMAAVGDKLYVVGGRGGSAVLVYDPAAKTWSKGAPLRVPRDHLAVAVVDRYVWALGGRDTDILPLVDVYDTQEDEWMQGPNLPEAMSAMAVGVLDDGLHVVGGEDPATLGGTVIDAHYVIGFVRPGEPAPEPAAMRWSEAPLPMVGVHAPAYGVLGGRLVLAGGARRQGALSPLGWTGITQAFASR